MFQFLMNFSVFFGVCCSHMVIENVDQPTFKLKMGTENVVGVKLPVFEPWASTAQSREYTGLGQGGQKVKACRETYFKALEALVEIASLQTTFVTLDQVIKITNRRVNAIEYVVKPRLVNTIASVEVELEELEREEMFRLKKIQQKKERDAAKAEAEAAKLGLAIQRPADVASASSHAVSSASEVVF